MLILTYIYTQLGFSLEYYILKVFVLLDHLHTDSSGYAV